MDSALSPETEGVLAMKTLSDDLKLLAAEYALGTLESADLARAMALEGTTEDFRQAVERWRGYLLALDDTAATLKPKPELWDKIQSALGAQLPKQKSLPAAPAGLNKVEVWREGLLFWRSLALAGMITSVLLAAVLWTGVLQRSSLPIHVAVLSTAEGRTAAIINVYADGTAELVPLEQIAAPKGQIIELWTQQAGMSTPVSIGMFGTATRFKLDLKSFGKPGDRDFFALTFEPAGGSPTGLPTGAILMKGFAATPL